MVLEFPASSSQLRLGEASWPSPASGLAEYWSEHRPHELDPTQQDVVDGEHSSQLVVFEDREPPKPAFGEQRDCLVHIRISLDGHRPSCHDALHQCRGPLAGRKATHHEVAIGHDSHQGVSVQDEHCSDAVLGHNAGHFGHAGTRRDSHRSLAKAVSDPHDDAPGPFGAPTSIESNTSGPCASLPMHPVSYPLSVASMYSVSYGDRAYEQGRKTRLVGPLPLAAIRREVEDTVVELPPDPSVAPPLRRVSLPGSRTLSIRPLRDTDVGGLIALYATLSEDDVYRRFFIGHAPTEKFIKEMVMIEEHGGYGLVATIEEGDGTERIVAEATYGLLPDGDGEIGITVTEDERGWLGPYLLDALAEAAAARGVRTLQAEVLVTNGRMLALLRARGFVVLDNEDQPTSIRVAIGTDHRPPSWPGTHDRPRLLVEVPGGHWRAEAAVRSAGFQVLACPGPLQGWSSCPALRGEPCPLAAGADIIVDAQPGDRGRSLLEAHRRLHPSIPLCLALPTEEGDFDTDVPRIPPGTDDLAVVGIVQRLAKTPAEGGDGTPNDVVS